MSAVSSGHKDIAEYLLHEGADANVVNSGGRAPLTYAASKNYISILKLLLKAGAKVNHKDALGSTALHRAASAGRAEAVLVLIEEGKARVDEEDQMKQVCRKGRLVANATSVLLDRESRPARSRALFLPSDPGPRPFSFHMRRRLWSWPKSPDTEALWRCLRAMVPQFVNPRPE